MVIRHALVFIAAIMAALAMGQGPQPGPQLEVGVPAQHPAMVALRFQRELGLSRDQVARIEAVRDSLTRQFQPARERLGMIQRRMEEMRQSGNPNPAEAQALQTEADRIGAALGSLVQRSAQAVAEILTPEQREKLMRLSEQPNQGSGDRDFPLFYAMQQREALGIAPQQFTKLQFLQADFIRAFAPLREQMELLQIELTSKPPTPEDQKRAKAVADQVQALKARFSERAVKEVLTPEQGAKLAAMLRG